MSGAGGWTNGCVSAYSFKAPAVRAAASTDPCKHAYAHAQQKYGCIHTYAHTNGTCSRAYTHIQIHTHAHARSLSHTRTYAHRHLPKEPSSATDRIPSQVQVSEGAVVCVRLGRGRRRGGLWRARARACVLCFLCVYLCVFEIG